MSETQQAKFDGWAIVDVLGHQRYVGYVTTEYFGTTAFFRVVTPDRERREHTLSKDEWISDYGNLSTGARLVYDAKAGETRLIGAGSIYMLTPATKEVAVSWLNDNDPQALVSVFHRDGSPIEKREEVYF